MKQTNIEMIRETALQFLYLEVQPNPLIPLFTDHPVFESAITYDPINGEMVNIVEDNMALQRIRDEYEKRIKKADLSEIFLIIRKNYHLTFLKFSKQYYSAKDFAKYLSYAWVNSENPNQDVNVNIKTLINWFSRAEKKYLMSKKDYEVFDSLPAEVEIYRGIGVGRSAEKGLSWTNDLKTADFFANRFNRGKDKGYILKGKIKKEDVFAFFNSRGENELLCNSSKIYDLKIVK